MRKYGIRAGRSSDTTRNRSAKRISKIFESRSLKLKKEEISSIRNAKSKPHIFDNFRVMEEWKKKKNFFVKTPSNLKMAFCRVYNYISEGNFTNFKWILTKKFNFSLILPLLLLHFSISKPHFQGVYFARNFEQFNRRWSQKKLKTSETRNFIQPSNKWDWQKKRRDWQKGRRDPAYFFWSKPLFQIKFQNSPISDI